MKFPAEQDENTAKSSYLLEQWQRGSDKEKNQRELGHPATEANLLRVHTRKTGRRIVRVMGVGNAQVYLLSWLYLWGWKKRGFLFLR